MAAIRVGLIAFSCEKCNDSPYIKDSLGCEKPLKDAATWIGPDDEFYNCPIRFITDSTYDFIEKYDCRKFYTGNQYEKESAKFLLAVRIFERYLSKFMEMKNGYPG